MLHTLDISSGHPQHHRVPFFFYYRGVNVRLNIFFFFPKTVETLKWSCLTNFVPFDSKKISSRVKKMTSAHRNPPEKRYSGGIDAATAKTRHCNHHYHFLYFMGRKRKEGRKKNDTVQ